MKVSEMNRTQLDHLAKELGISHPQYYNLPELRADVKARYRKKKSERVKNV